MMIMIEGDMEDESLVGKAASLPCFIFGSISADDWTRLSD